MILLSGKPQYLSFTMRNSLYDVHISHDVLTHTNLCLCILKQLSAASVCNSFSWLLQLKSLVALNLVKLLHQINPIADT